MVGIYKITNQLNNKCYIGQSIDIETRWKQHIYESKVLRHKYSLYLAMHDEGIENFSFEILEICPLQENILDARERYWIQYYHAYENGYNATRGGQGENRWKYDPQIIRDLWDEGYSFGEIVTIVGCSKGIAQQKLKGYHDYNTSTSHSRGIRHAIKTGKMQHLMLGNKYTFSNDELSFLLPSVAVHQYSLSGEYITSYASLAEAARALGVMDTHGDTNISHVLYKKQQIAYGYQWSKEKVKALPPVPVHLGKLVKCVETGQIFHSTKEAAAWCGLKSSTPIKDYCRGVNYNSAGKHPETGEKLHWEYVE